MKINVKKLKERLNQQETKSKSKYKKKDPRESLFVKPLGKEEETILFRALPYVHNADPASEPFVTRAYHYIPGQGNTWCPQENDGKRCGACDLIWEQMKKNKGPGDEKKKMRDKWSNYLPKYNMYIPGVIRGREDEGIKFLRVGASKFEQTERQKKIWGWFFNEYTEDWMDFDEGKTGGFDMELKYVPMTPDQQKQFKATLKLGEVDLARNSSTLEDSKSWLKKIPNLDVDHVPVLTPEEMDEVMIKWAKKQKLTLKKPETSNDDSDDLEVEAETKTGNPVKAKAAKKKEKSEDYEKVIEDLDGRLDELGI